MYSQKRHESHNELKVPQKTFRTVHYLGSKLRILEFIEEVIDDIDPSQSGVCDLFSGSGAISQHLSLNRKILAVDIQRYSNVICSAILKPIRDKVIDSFVEKVRDSGKLSDNVDSFKQIVEYEESLLKNDSTINLEEVCDFLECCSLYSASISLSLPECSSLRLKQSLGSAVNTVSQSSHERFLAVKYFGGLYFSYKQAAHLDAILECINQADEKYRNVFMAALLSTASDIVNIVGKQFAQPIRPRNKNGQPKKGLIKQLRKDRCIDVLPLYHKWLLRYSSREVKNLDHEVLQSDFLKALDSLDDSIQIVYADPPYTRDHYSRFYHGLETLCLGDHPDVSKVKVDGEIRLSRGLYREDRYQSVFCIKSQAPAAFESLFKKVSELGKVLLLSYSPYDKSKGSHPRVVELEDLEVTAAKYFKHVEVKSPGSFSHNKFNRTDLHLEVIDVSEVLLVCRN